MVIPTFILHFFLQIDNEIALLRGEIDNVEEEIQKSDLIIIDLVRRVTGSREKLENFIAKNQEKKTATEKSISEESKNVERSGYILNN